MFQENLVVWKYEFNDTVLLWGLAFQENLVVWKFIDAFEIRKGIFSFRRT